MRTRKKASDCNVVVVVVEKEGEWQKKTCFFFNFVFEFLF